MREISVLHTCNPQQILHGNDVMKESKEKDAVFALKGWKCIRNQKWDKHSVPKKQLNVAGGI